MLPVLEYHHVFPATMLLVVLIRLLLLLLVVVVVLLLLLLLLLLPSGSASRAHSFRMCLQEAGDATRTTGCKDI
jgi:hypothetical protein